MNDTSFDRTRSTSGSIDPATSLGPATLAVADAERSLAFYRDLLGFEVLGREGQRITLGAAGVTLLTLLVQPGLRPRPLTTTGLYHVAILLPTRRDLAYTLNRLLEARYPFGASDHLVSEALYISDPDANGLEIYRDRPRAEWRWQPDGQIVMTIDPLDTAGILAELQDAGVPWRGMPAGTTIGHMHLQVSDIPTAEAFYHTILGFDVMARLQGALFLGAGGYHHHIGLNTWNSYGALLQPEDAAGLRSFVIRLPHAEALARVRERIAAAGLPVREQQGALALDDPWRNTVLLAQIVNEGDGS